MNSQSRVLSTLELFELRLVNARSDAVLDELQARFSTREKTAVAFINAHCVNQLGDSTYRAALGRMSYLLPDGSGLSIAARLQGWRFVANLNGTDLVPLLCARLAAARGSVFLLGARPGVAEDAAAQLGARYPGLRVVGAHHGYFAPADEPQIINAINTARPDLLLVGFGVPKQDIWIDQHIDDLDATLVMGIGALLDFTAGRVPRAPVILRWLGLEWCWRLYREPRRLWRRYLIGNAIFLARAAKAACRGKD